MENKYFLILGLALIFTGIFVLVSTYFIYGNICQEAKEISEESEDELDDFVLYNCILYHLNFIGTFLIVISGCILLLIYRKRKLASV
ncbi:MAG: hypothetical protein ACMXX8_03390 [Candidatus Woesearchaeota archaeon]